MTYESKRLTMDYRRCESLRSARRHTGADTCTAAALVQLHRVTHRDTKVCLPHKPCAGHQRAVR